MNDEILGFGMSQSTALPCHGAEPAGDYVSAAGMAPVRVAGG
jgi:hypothetical protein